MGERITFRERTEGVAVEGASIMEPLVKYVRGQVTSGEPDAGFVACGDRTDFPMEVTGATVREKLDKIAEIFYRAKCWKFTEGHVNADGITLAFNGIAPLADKFLTTEFTSGGTETQYIISPHLYYTYYGEVLPLGFEHYFSDGYESGYWLANDHTIFDAVTEYAIFFPRTHPWEGGSYYNDIWHPSLRLGAIYGLIALDEDHNLLNPDGYGINLSGDFYYSDYKDNGWLWAEADIIPLIAFTGDDGPYHADSRLFLNVSFNMAEHDGPYIFSHGFANNDDTGIKDTGVNFVMRLSSGDLTARLYVFDDSDVESASDCVITPFRWWPYAHPNGSPVWNEETGAYIPEGP